MELVPEVEVEEAIAELVSPVLMDGVAVFPVAFVAAVVFVLVFMMNTKREAIRSKNCGKWKVLKKVGNIIGEKIYWYENIQIQILNFI